MKVITTLTDCTPDPQNANAGSLRGEQLLDRSMREYGAGRSIVVDRNGVVIGGNKTLQLAVEMGLPVRVVQSDGSKLVAVVRMDLDLAADPRARLLAYFDNRAAQMGLRWNAEQLAADLDAGLNLGSLFTKAEAEAILHALDADVQPPAPEPSANPLTTTLTFKTGPQRDAWLTEVQTITALPGATFPDQLMTWVDTQLAGL